MDAKLKAAERFELRYARSKEVRWCLGFVLDALLAPAMLPADGWSVRLVAERCELDCDDDAEPVHPARLVAGNAVDVLCERFISVTRGRWNRARWNDPDDTLWGLGL
ncbi:MAG: hypothetical protein FJ027_18970 [Candidatus Rokubacteria bacterium]|nr:hypothetical protein [Candidatus Rokubacteria bacterium]